MFLLLLLFMCSNEVNAINIKETGLGKYAKIYKYNFKEQVVEIKKLVDTDTNTYLFRLSPNDKLNSNNYVSYKNDFSKWKISKNYIDFFLTIVNYNFESELENDFNYYITQCMIYSAVTYHDVKLTDKNGVIDTALNNLMDSKLQTTSKFFLKDDIFKKTYKIKNGEVLNINSKNNLKVVDDLGLEIDINKNNIKIKGDYKGLVNPLFTTTYEENNFIYTDGISSFYANLGGPANIINKLNIEVDSIKLNIHENLNNESIFNHITLNNSKYEIYKDNILIKEVNDLNNVYLNKNSEYKIKDITNDRNILNSKDITFKTSEDDYDIYIDKDVVLKEIIINISSDKKYLLYEKNNKDNYYELEKINNLKLPTGNYIIEYDNNVIKEFDTNKDELNTIFIDDTRKDENLNNENNNGENNNEVEEKNEIIKSREDNNKEKLSENEENNNDFENIENKNDNYSEIINPKTKDNIFYYVSFLIISVFGLVFRKKLF